MLNSLLASLAATFLTVTTAPESDTCLRQFREGRAAMAGGSYRDAETLLRDSSTCYEALGESVFLASVLMELGRTLREQDRQKEMLPLYERALHLLEEKRNEHPVEYSSALNNLATAKHYMGRYSEAQALYLRAIAMFEHLPGNNLGIVRALNNLASIALSQADYAGSERYLKRALPLIENPNSLERAMLLNQLGVLYGRLSRKEAESLFREALSLREGISGPNHPETVSVLNNLAHQLDEQGKSAEAEPFALRSSATCRSAFGLTPRCAIVLNVLASVEEKSGRGAEAEAHWREAISVLEASPGVYVDAFSASLNNLGKYYTSIHRYVEARQLLSRAIEVWPKDASNPDLASSYTNLGIIDVEEKKYSQAQQWLSRALEMDLALLGPDHSKVAIDCNNLGVLAAKRKHYDDAERLLLRSIGIDEKALGDNSRIVAHRTANLATVYFARRRYGEAAVAFGRAFKIWGQSTGLVPETEAALLEQYAVCLKQVQQYAEAEKADVRAMNLRVKSALRKS